jgi:hypothetical protein
METQEALETLSPLEDAPVDEVVEEETAVTEEHEVPAQPTPKIQRKRPPRPPPVTAVPPIADPKFWSDMLVTKREQDRQATHTRYANLVKF